MRSSTRGDVGVLVDHPRRLAAEQPAEPREFAHGHERQPLVVHLEDLALRVERVAPGRAVVCDARVQGEVVAPAGDRERVELERAEPADDLHHRIRAAHERARGREEVPGDEKAACGLGGDLHRADAR